MLGRPDAIGVDEAIRLISESLSDFDVPTSIIQIEKASGRIIAEDVVSPEDLPGFSRSTVDGYAVRSSDTFGATENSPAYLRIVNEIFMGEEPDFELCSGEAARIATGGMVPRGADSVVMLEHAQTAPGDMIEAQRPIAPKANVIEKGEDIGRGELLLARGGKLRPQDIAALAGIGITRVFVYEKPVVSIISTGDEIVPASAESLRPGIVRDMNSYNLSALLDEAGATPVMMGIIRDDYESLISALGRDVKASSMVLITGGSSVGARDMTARVLSDLGRILFHYVSVKPGKPTLFGLVGKVPVFGLPGHPRAVAVCFEIFVKHALKRITGRNIYSASDKHGRSVRVKLAKSIRSEIGKQEYASVSLEELDGELCAVPLPGKSGLITMLVKGDGIVAVPAGSPGLQSGEIVEVRLL